ncbi:MAG: sulfatase family protein [Planctomycetota bacterium]|jgi:arylsulfatase A-like enzyme
MYDRFARSIWSGALVCFLSTTIVSYCFAQDNKPGTVDRPNIVILITHDTGRHFGCYGIETVNSPHIDGLAGGGVLFKRSFCVAPQCSPSRSALYTGRFPHATGVMSVVQQEFEWDLHAGERHIAGFLKEAGYRTFRIGVGHEMRRDPKEMGFTDVIKVPHKEGEYFFTCDEVAETTVKVFEEMAKDNLPFYAQIGFFETHRGFEHGGVKPDSTKGVTIPLYIIDEPSARADFAAFQGAIKKVDASIGSILRGLEDWGLSENTIVIFTVDHGIPFPRAKMTPYDAGIEVAIIMRWPAGGWSGGKVYDPMISNVDVLPTILELLDIPVPDNIHGQSFLGLLNGTEYTPRSEIFAESYGWGQGENTCRCVFPSSGDRALRSGQGSA